MSYRILIIDDERTLLHNVQAYLENEGYLTRTAEDGPSGLEIVRRFKPDLIVLDIMLPGMDGLELLRRLRQESNVYILMLTAKTEEVDKVVGLNLGADDYMTKPFSPRELTARIKAILRRGRTMEEEQSPLIFQRLRIDPNTREVWRDRQLVDLTPIEFDLLHALAQNQRRVMSREQLIEKVWGVDYYGDERVVDVHIGRLRKKVEDDPADPKLILTVRSAGYRFQDEAA